MSYALIVEDDRWLGESYQKTLERAGVRTALVQSGYEAMDVIDAEVPSVIVADIMLDGHTTFTLFHELQSYDDTKDIPIIICSGVVDRSLTEEKLKSYGVVEVLDKATVTNEILVDAVKEHGEFATHE